MFFPPLMKMARYRQPGHYSRVRAPVRCYEGWFGSEARSPGAHYYYFGIFDLRNYDRALLLGKLHTIFDPLPLKYV
jgi:hypothetical protein